MRVRHCPVTHSDRAKICPITRTDGDAIADMGYIALIAPTRATGA